MSLWNDAYKLVVGNDPVRPRDIRSCRVNSRDLIRRESKIGADIFGQLSSGHRREFFYFDNYTWIWYEEWNDKAGHRQSLTTRYEVHPNGVLKVQDGQPYTVVEGNELRNLFLAMRLYYERTSRQIYHRDPSTRLPLPAVEQTEAAPA